MPTKFVQQAVCVVRDGKFVYPPTGKSFAFTDKEVEEISEMNPTALRDPVNEASAAPVAAEAPAAKAPTKAAKGKGEEL